MRKIRRFRLSCACLRKVSAGPLLYIHTFCSIQGPLIFKDASHIHLFKQKRNSQVCDNHQGISLLSVAGKILRRILLNRLSEHLEQSGLPPESQCGFRKDRGTTDMVFTTRQLQEKCQEQNVDSK